MTDSMDFRVKPTFFTHYKTGRLMQALGYVGIVTLWRVWGWATENQSDGRLTNMTAEDIEFAVMWKGKKGRFVKTLVEIGWLDVTDDGVYCIHDWQEHNPWAAGAQLRSDMGRMGKLASNYPEIYARYAAAGIRHISKKDYEREIQEYKTLQAGKADNTLNGPTANDLSNSRDSSSETIQETQFQTTLVKEGHRIRNFGDPNGPACAPSPVPLHDKDHDQGNPENPPVPGSPQNHDRRLATKKPIPSNKMVKKTINERDLSAQRVKVYLEPDEIEAISPDMLPEGMTEDEVRAIRQEVRERPGFSDMPPFLQEATLRVTPFSVARDRKAGQDQDVKPKAASSEGVSTPRRRIPTSTQGVARGEGTIWHDAGNFAALLRRTKELYRSFPGYSPTKNEDEWIITLCQEMGTNTYTLIQEALDWVRWRSVPVRNARGFVTGWIKRVAAERKIPSAYACTKIRDSL